MNGILPGYFVDVSTWLYLSLLLTVTIYFRFKRVWSLRNVDLFLLISLSPGLLIVEYGSDWGYVWLFAISGAILLRLFWDSQLLRRPLLQENLNNSGMAFLSIAMFIFIMSIAITNDPKEITTSPTEKLLAAPVEAITKQAINNSDPANEATSEATTLRSTTISTRIFVIILHAVIVAGLLYIGQRRFGDRQLGLSMAMMYLLLPCTAFAVGEMAQVLPAALIVWAVAAYRRPLISGGLMGFACGTVLYPIFLLPLWVKFYDRGGKIRFVSSMSGVFLILIFSLMLVSYDSASFFSKMRAAIDLQSLSFNLNEDSAKGFWSTYESAYRIPVITVYVIMVFSLTVWPWKQNFEQLIAHSTAIIVGTQFWYPQQGGVYVLWYMPLFLLVIFRPHLRHQTAPDFTQSEKNSQNQGNKPDSLNGSRNVLIDSGTRKKSSSVPVPAGVRGPHRNS